MKKHLMLAGLLVLAISCSDDETITALKTDGVVITRERLIAYFPQGSISESRMNEIADTINLGIELSQQYMGGPFDWQTFKDRQITYYFCPGNFISGTSKEGDIFLPVGRAKNNQSPWLHETMHILLRSEEGNWNPKSNPMNYFRMPVWLTEGMAEYLAMKVSYDYYIPKYDMFKSGGYLLVDSTCNISIKEEKGPYILKYIGEPGMMIQLYTGKRRYYAPTFYNCSCSFTKYLVETYGLDRILEAFTDYKNEIKTIEELSGKTIKELKDEWLVKISNE
jgi:hypothetical protein